MPKNKKNKRGRLTYSMDHPDVIKLIAKKLLKRRKRKN
jgi:hypothetical protein